MTTLTFVLTRPAKKNGGDRYECPINGTDQPIVFYIPQDISREKGTPKQSLTITIS